MEREVRYCTTEDGVRIAYCVEGQGPPILVLPFFIESFSLDHLLPDHHSFLLKLTQGRQMIRFDVRGVGLSQREVSDVSIDAVIGDGKTVLDTCGVEKTDIWASTTLGPIALAFTLNYPERVNRLVLYGTCGSMDQAFPNMLTTFEGLASGNWALACQVFADLTGRVGYPDAALKLAEWYRESTSGAVVAQFIRHNRELDVTSSLSRITVPTLVMHRMEDPTIAFDLGRAMAAEIQNARFIPLQGTGANLPIFGDPDPIIEAATAFLDEGFRSGQSASADTPAAGSPFRTVLFTDLVGHTAMMHRLGDEKGRAVLREHETVTRNVLKDHGGAEVKTMGDGFMASFPSVTRAVECALALQHAFNERNEAAAEPLHVRVGLNAGEPIEEDGDLFGETVILAARVAAMAQGGEILASLAVRELCAGKGFLFADLGDHAMRGFEDPVRVFEIKRPA